MFYVSSVLFFVIHIFLYYSYPSLNVGIKLGPTTFEIGTICKRNGLVKVKVKDMHRQSKVRNMRSFEELDRFFIFEINSP